MKSTCNRAVIVGLMAAAIGSAGAQSPPVSAEQKSRAESSTVQQAEPAATQSAAPVPKQPTGKRPAKASSGQKPLKAMDRLELEASQITGNRELPKVMVVVPWKRSDIGDVVGRPVNSLVDEALQPVDREVFRREIDYYGALTPDHPRVETRVTGGTTTERPEK
jgi:hypothetical protein